MENTSSTLQFNDNDEDAKPVFTTTKLQELHLYSLVLSAAGITHKISKPNRTDWGVYVPERDHEKALYEIYAYNTENSNWPLQPQKVDNFSPFFRAQSFLIVLSLVLFFSFTGPWSQHSAWFTEGSINSSRILNHGEYYRLLTALTLHSDLVHLLGNCFLGGFLLHFYFLLLGNGIGLSSLIIASVLGNYINVLIHGAGHNSIGFSTAVFSVIGILSALNYRHYKLTRPERLVLPIMAGAAMLAMLGSSGVRTDLGAHLFGLTTGLVVGTILGIDSIFSLRHHGWLQFILSVVFLILPFLAWYLAMI